MITFGNRHSSVVYSGRYAPSMPRHIVCPDPTYGARNMGIFFTCLPTDGAGRVYAVVRYACAYTVASDRTDRQNGRSISLPETKFRPCYLSHHAHHLTRSRRFSSFPPAAGLCLKRETKVGRCGVVLCAKPRSPLSNDGTNTTVLPHSSSDHMKNLRAPG